MIDYFAV